MDTPLCQLNHTPQILLNEPEDLPYYRQTPARFAGAVAPDGESCAQWANSLAPLPVGRMLDCPLWPEEDGCERPVTVRYIDRCKRLFRPQLKEEAAIYHLRSAPGFAALRAAVLAIGELTGRAVIAEVAIEDGEGRMADGTDVRAALGVLQCIGVTTIVLTAHDPEAMTAALDLAAPYARMAIGACVHSAWLRAQTKLYNIELVLPADHDDTARLLKALDDHTGGETVPRDHGDFILAPDGKNAHFIDATIDISDEIECGPRLEAALIEAEDDAGALKLVLETEDDVIKLEEFRYMISRPLCLCAASAELLEQGLRVFPGLALYDGTWEQPEDVLHYLEKKYGLIRL